MIVKKFKKMVLKVNLESETEEFFTICKVFGSGTFSLRYTRKEWNYIRRLALGDETILPLIQQVLKKKHPKDLCERHVSIFDAKIEVSTNLILLFNQVLKSREVIIYPYSKSEQNTLRIQTVPTEPKSFIIIDYSQQATLADKYKYLRLWKRLGKNKEFKGLEELIFEETSIKIL